MSDLEKLRHHLSILKEEFLQLNKKFENSKLNNIFDTASYSFVLCNAIKSLFNSNVYSDYEVKFNCEESLKLHKFILTARNPKIWNVNYFINHDHLFLDTSYNIGYSIFKWIYFNEIDLSQEKLESLLEYLKMSCQLGIDQLIEICQNHIIPICGKENCICIYEKAIDYNAGLLKQFSSKIISNHWDEFSHADFVDTHANILYNLIKGHCQFPLHSSIKLHRKDVIMLFLSENSSTVPEILNQVDPITGDLALDLAFKTQQFEIAKLLIKNKVDLNACDKLGVPILHKAIFRLDQISCDLLLDSGADANVINLHTRQNCLHLLANLKELISQNSNKNSPDNKTPRKMEYSTLNGSLDNEEKEGSLDGIYDVNENVINDDEFYITIGSDSKTSLNLPNFDVEQLIKKLIRLNIDVNAIDYDGKTPLHIAIENGLKPVFDILLVEAGSLLDITHVRDLAGHSLLWTTLVHLNHHHHDALPSSCQFEREERDTPPQDSLFYMANKLIQLGTPYKDICNPVTGLPLLNELLLDGHVEAVKYLIRLPEVNFNCFDNNGIRPIHILAEFEEYVEVARIMLDLGKRNVEKYHLNGLESDLIDLDLEETQIHQDNSNLINEVSSTTITTTKSHPMPILNVNVSTYAGDIPINIAIRSKNWPFIDMLTDHYAPNLLSNVNNPNYNLNLNIFDSQDESPLSLALLQQNYDLATKLIFLGADIHMKLKSGKSLIQNYIENGLEEQAIYLLENGATFRQGAESPQNQENQITNCQDIFQMAIRKELMAVVKALCQLGIDVNCEFISLLEEHNNYLDSSNLPVLDVKGTENPWEPLCPLWYSLKLGKYDIAKVLVQYGCDTTFWHEGPDRCLQTLLHRAIDENMEDVACFLVRSNCDVNCVRKPGPTGDTIFQGCQDFLIDNQTPLHMACVWGSDKLVPCLLEHKADVNIADCESKTPLHLAIENQRSTIIKSLLNHPFINLTIKDKNGWTAFETAMGNKNLEAAQMIVDREPSAPEQVDNKGFNFLHISVRKGDVENVLFLLGVKANVNSRVHDYLQNTPLHLAAKESTEIILRNLILAGSDVNARNSEGKAPLHLAIIHENSEYAKILIENGADLRILDSNGNSALHLAVQGSDVDCIEYLLSQTDISISQTDNKQRTPLHLIGVYVKDNGVTILDLFKQYRPQLNTVMNMQDNEGNTPLLLAYLNGRGNLCRSLVKVGSALGISNNDGISIFNAPVASHQLLFRLLDMLTEEPCWTESDSCNECNTKFGITMRKHHCRHCGRVLCTKCSDRTLPIPKFNLPKPVRVCSVCYDILTTRTS